MKLLEGVRILDLSWLIPGPYTTMLLADLGADVIKLEAPGGGDYFRAGSDPGVRGGNSLYFLWLNRNKRSVAVDFRTDEGRQIIHALVGTAQVFVEGARPGSFARHGLGYEDLRSVNPKLVYCSITGFGQTGPFAQMATHGGAYDAVAGIAQPYRLKNGSYVQHRPYPHAGVTHGPWLAATAIMAGLLRAQATGQGTYIDLSCADAALMAMGQEILPALNGGKASTDPEESPSAKYSYYRTKDDRFFLLLCLEQHFWDNFCEAVGRPDLKEHGDWSVSKMDSALGDLELRDELTAIFRTRTQAEWTELFLQRNIAGAPYYPLEEIADSELFRAREMIVEERTHPTAGSYRMTANAIKVAGDPFELTRPAPGLGQHTGEVLAELGYTVQQSADLRARGVIQ